MSNKLFDPKMLGVTEQEILPRDTETAAHRRAEQRKTIGDSVHPAVSNFGFNSDPNLAEKVSRRVLDGVSSETGIFAKGGASEMTREGVLTSLDSSEADGTGTDKALDSVSRASTLAYQAARAEPPKSFHTVSDLCEKAAKHLQAIKDNEGNMPSHLRSAAAACINAIGKHHFADMEVRPDKRKL